MISKVVKRFRDSPLSKIKSRLSLCRQPREISPIRRKPSSTPLQFTRQPSFTPNPPPSNSEICSKYDNYETAAVEELACEGISHAGDDNSAEQNIIVELGSKKKRRKWGHIVENANPDEIVTRLRKISSKGHRCTKCDHFRLSKYFSDASCMVCISCLDICFKCNLVIEPPPVKKERHPICSSCNEKKITCKKAHQRSSMEALRLKKKT